MLRKLLELGGRSKPDQNQEAMKLFKVFIAMVDALSESRKKMLLVMGEDCSSRHPLDIAYGRHLGQEIDTFLPAGVQG